MNLGDLMYLESKTTLKDSLYSSLIGQESTILKPKIEFPTISNTLKVPEDKFATVQRNLSNFIVYQNTKHKKTASEKVPDVFIEKEIDESKYH